MTPENIKQAFHLVSMIEVLQKKIATLGHEDWAKRYKLIISPDSDRPSPTFIDLERDDFEQIKSTLLVFWTKKIEIYRKELENFGVKTET